MKVTQTSFNTIEQITNVHHLSDSEFDSSGYTTEKIIGTSTSTSIQVNPIQQVTESNVGATFVDMHQNASYPPGFESTPSTASGVFEYNSTVPSIGSLFNNTYHPDFFTSSTTPVPQLEGVDYKTSKFLTSIL